MSDINNNETFGQYISRLRQEKGYSQRRLAQLCEISNTTISRIENGDTPNPDLPTIKALSAVLGVEESHMLNAAGYLSKSPAVDKDGLTIKDLKDIQKKLEHMQKFISDDPKDGLAAFDGVTDIPEDDQAQLMDAFNIALRIVKKLNKETYTPNKYKKDNK